MTLLEILTFASLWCSDPAASRLQIADVHQCRVNVINCLGDKPKDDKLKKCALDHNIK